MVHSVSGCTRGVLVKLWDPLRMRAIPERLRGVFTTRSYTNPRLPLPSWLLAMVQSIAWIKLTCCVTYCASSGKLNSTLFSCLMHLVPGMLCKNIRYDYWITLWTAHALAVVFWSVPSREILSCCCYSFPYRFFFVVSLSVNNCFCA